jgi:HK97 gp10 family phage protein
LKKTESDGMHFGSMGQFAEHLLTAATAEAIALHNGLEKCAKLIEKTAKAEIGHYQPAVGPFQDWAELADCTKDNRTRQGYTENDPLLRTGELRDSITHETAGLEAIIGSTSPVMAYQEFGTPSIPPRPVIGPAAFRNKAKIQKIIGLSAISGFTYGSRIHTSLGYDMEID